MTAATASSHTESGVSKSLVTHCLITKPLIAAAIEGAADTLAGIVSPAPAGRSLTKTLVKLAQYRDGCNGIGQLDMDSPMGLVGD